MKIQTAETAASRRAKWLALWAALKGVESLIGHLADLAKARALGPPPLPPAE